MGKVLHGNILIKSLKFRAKFKRVIKRIQLYPRQSGDVISSSQQSLYYLEHGEHDLNGKRNLLAYARCVCIRLKLCMYVTMIVYS